MAGATGGLHVLKLKPPHVPDSLITGNKFVKWDDDSSVGVPVTLWVDPKGFILYWRDQKREMDFLDISSIRDARTGKHARLPKDRGLRDTITMGTQDCPLEDKIVTVCYGTDMVNVSFVNFAATSKEVAKEWMEEIFKLSTNLIALNGSTMQFLKKCQTKLSLIRDTEGKIPVRNIVKMFAQSKEDRRKVQNALEAARLPHGNNDRLNSLSFEEFFSFYQHITERNEVAPIFFDILSQNCESKPYINAEQFMNFLNKEQRDSRLNEVLYPYCDLTKAKTLIQQFEYNKSLSTEGHLSKDGFLRYLLSGENAIMPIEKLDLSDDMTQPLSHYFINSSHNTYLTGHQLTGKSSVEIYRQALLSGCRCVELDCWDGRNTDEEPIITHGFTMCTEISLKEVLEAIAETAFKSSEYPLILSFENHCSPKQQVKIKVKIAQYCRHIFGEALLIDPFETHKLEPNIPLPSPELLRRRIIVKNKKRHLHKYKSTIDTKSYPETPRLVVQKTASNTSVGSVRSENKSLDLVESGNKSLDLVESGNKSLDPVESGNKSLDPVESGNKSLDLVESGNKSLNLVESGNKSLDPVESGNKSLDMVESGNKSLDLVESGNKSLDPVESGNKSLDLVESGGENPDGEGVTWITGNDDAGEDSGSDSEDGSEREELEMTEELKKMEPANADKGTAGQEAAPGMEMSALVNYVQPARFYSFENSEKRNRSYECNSFVESQALALLKSFPLEFVNFNKMQISRIYPKGTRVDSSNYMPQIFWNVGCQLVALNYQTLDLAMQLNLGIFEYNGRSGFLLKPDFMRRKDRQFDPFTESTVDGIVAGSVEVKIISGQFLTDKRVGTYVEVEMFGLPADTVRHKFRTKVVPANGINPVYNEDPFVFKKVILPDLATLRIAVHHENGTTLIGHRVLPVIGLRPGYRHIGLRNECNQPQGLATLFVHITCKDYIMQSHADIVAALVNPIAYHTQKELLEKHHASQLAILEEDEFENACTVVLSDSDEKNQKRRSNEKPRRSTDMGKKKLAMKGREYRTVLKDGGGFASRQISIQDHSPGSLSSLSSSSSESSLALQGESKSVSVPNSPLHASSVDSNSGKFQKLDLNSSLSDVGDFCHVSLSTVKSSKQYQKVISRLNKELVTLRRKHEKARSSKFQTHQLEIERLMSVLRAKKKLLNCGVIELSQSTTEFELRVAKKQQAKDLLRLCYEQDVEELEVQTQSQVVKYECLQQLLHSTHETYLSQLKKSHDKVVAQLKKKNDSQNWDEMKQLKDRHKGDELIRYQLESRISEANAIHAQVLDQMKQEKKQFEDHLKRVFNKKHGSRSSTESDGPGMVERNVVEARNKHYSVFGEEVTHL